MATGVNVSKKEYSSICGMQTEMETGSKHIRGPWGKRQSSSHVLSPRYMPGTSGGFFMEFS